VTRFPARISARADRVKAGAGTDFVEGGIYKLGSGSGCERSWATSRCGSGGQDWRSVDDLVRAAAHFLGSLRFGAIAAAAGSGSAGCSPAKSAGLPLRHSPAPASSAPGASRRWLLMVACACLRPVAPSHFAHPMVANRLSGNLREDSAGSPGKSAGALRGLPSATLQPRQRAPRLCAAAGSPLRAPSSGFAPVRHAAGWLLLPEWLSGVRRPRLTLRSPTKLVPAIGQGRHKRLLTGLRRTSN
jgi:hypothetical protein